MVDCTLCNISLEEALQLDDDKAWEEIIAPMQMCVDHMISYLNIRKSYGLIGKDLVVAIKRLETLR